MFNTRDNGKRSPGHGVWERTAAESAGGTTPHMRYDALGFLIGFMRARTALHLTDDPDHMEGVIYLKNASCEDTPGGCADLLSSDLVWTTGRFVEVSGIRIEKSICKRRAGHRECLLPRMNNTRMN